MFGFASSVPKGSIICMMGGQDRFLRWFEDGIGQERGRRPRLNMRGYDEADNNDSLIADENG